MVRIEYEGHKLTKAWSGRLLYEIKDHKSVEKWERDIRHTIEDPKILIWHPVVEPPTQAEKAMYSNFSTSRVLLCLKAQQWMIARSITC